MSLFAHGVSGAVGAQDEGEWADRDVLGVGEGLEVTDAEAGEHALCLLQQWRDQLSCLGCVLHEAGGRDTFLNGRPHGFDH